MQRNHRPAPVQCYPQAPYNAVSQASYNAIPQSPYSTIPPPPYNAIPQPPYNATTAASHNARNAHRDVPVTTVIRACRTAGFGKWRWRLGATTDASFSYIYSTNTAATAKSPPPWRPLNSVGFLARIFFFCFFFAVAAAASESQPPRHQLPAENRGHWRFELLKPGITVWPATANDPATKFPLNSEGLWMCHPGFHVYLRPQATASDRKPPHRPKRTEFSGDRNRPQATASNRKQPQATGGAHACCKRPQTRQPPPTL